MIIGTIWGTALALYVLFRAWYDNWRGPVRPDEIEAFLRNARARGADKLNDLDIVRKFLEEDDGREFVMLNLVRVAPGMVADPDTGVPTDGRKLLARYTGPFMRRLFLHGGHPALAARKIGGYVDAWHVPPDPGWTIMGYMRYRSRRDMMQLAGDPTFDALHKFKVAGTAETFSFPTRPLIRIFVGPRLWVFLVLALAAALAHIAVLTFG
jgi:hypothetical protein